MSLATEQQIDYIIELYNELNPDNRARWIGHLHHLTQRERKGGMTRAEASTEIDRLKREIAAAKSARPPAPTARSFELAVATLTAAAQALHPDADLTILDDLGDPAREYLLAAQELTLHAKDLERYGR